MNFLLADLLMPNLQPPPAAGAGAAAPSPSEAGGFAAALEAFRAGTAETPDGEHGMVLPVVPKASGATPNSGSEIAAALDASLIPGAAAPIMRVDAATVETGEAVPPPSGLADPLAIEPAIEDVDGETLEEVAVDAPDAVAGIVPPPVTAADPALTDDTEIALKIAEDARRSPLLPDASEFAPPSETSPEPLREGRASVAGPPPSPGGPAGTTTASTAGAIDIALPRATADVSVSNAASPAPATPQSTAPVSQPLVPQPAHAIAATPHVVSVQGSVDKMTASPATAETAVPQQAGSAPAASGAPAQAAPVTAVPIATVSEEGTDPPQAVPPALETEAKTADGALAVLTKDRVGGKSVAPTAPVAAPDNAEVAEPKPAAEAKPEPAPADKPAPDRSGFDKPAPEKPAATGDIRTPQAPMADRPLLADTTVKPVQPSSHTLPAAAIPQIASEVATKFKQGKTRFEIRLDPPELGRVDVRIEVDNDGRITSRLTVEKSETLDLLKADQRALERALHEAGFKSEQNSLSFALKDDRGGQQKFDEQRFLREQAPAESEEAPARLVADLAYRAPVRGPGGFDLRV